LAAGCSPVLGVLLRLAASAAQRHTSAWAPPEPPQWPHRVRKRCTVLK
jgi:hypothetical protein